MLLLMMTMMMMIMMMMMMMMIMMINSFGSNYNAPDDNDVLIHRMNIIC